jgi:hypothetical protein
MATERDDYFIMLMLGHYETKNAQPRGRAQKNCDALDTTVHFLVNGNREDKANATLQDAEVIRYFKAVDALH